MDLNGRTVQEANLVKGSSSDHDSLHDLWLKSSQFAPLLCCIPQAGSPKGTRALMPYSTLLPIHGSRKNE